MFKGNSNFPRSTPWVSNGSCSADINSEQWSPVTSTGSHPSSPTTAPIYSVERWRSASEGRWHCLVEADSDLSLGVSLSEQQSHASTTHSNSIRNSAGMRKHDELEESADPLSTDSESVGTVDEAFELLSAYLDNEVTEAERCLVQHWLASDPDIKSDYQKQLQLRQALKSFMCEGL